MNFPGKFGSIISGAHPAAFVDVDAIRHHNSGDGSSSITIPDAQLLFNGDYKRSGVDLILSKGDHQLVVPGYFKGENRASLASPDGANLTGDIVNALAGNVEYAQASGATDANRVIGHVTKLTGSATAIRNGVSIILNNGDNVDKGDVVLAGSDSQLGITFIDGTVFGLSSNARMVLNEMVYDPNGSSNSSLLTLVAGTISFVAGETAKHGDMKVDTPTAVLGIRGTAVLVEIDFTVPASGTTPAVNFQVLAEPDGHTGSYILFSKPTNGTPPVEIGRVDQSGLSYSVTANNQLASTTAPALSPQAAAVVLETFVEKFNAPPPPPAPPPAPDKTAPNNANPNSTGGGGSSTPPPPATPLDTSPIDNHNTQPTTETPTPTPISTTPTPNNVVAPPTTTTITTAAANGPTTTIIVTSAQDTPSFTISQHVTTPSTPPPTFVAFVPGSGTVESVQTTENAPQGVDLTKLISIDETTGAVSYNPADFAFLKQGQSAVATIAFQSNDGVENVPETLTLTIDGAAPAPPTVLISNPDVVTNAATQTISGTVTPGLAAAGDTVTLFDTVNGLARQVGTATLGSDGSWTATVTLSGDGAHSIVAQDTDAVGNVGASAPVVVTLDTVAPTVTITTAAETSNIATQPISGSVTAGEAAVGTTVTLFDTIDGVTSQIGSATVGGDGSWTTSVILSGDGAHYIVALDSDAAGNIATSTPVVFTLNSPLPPAVTITTAAETSNVATQTISGNVTAGTATIGATVALFDTVNGVTTQVGNATVASDGAWTTNVALSGDGAHSIVAQDIDANGNLGVSAPIVLTLDTVAPTVAIGTSGTTTNQATQTISGTVTTTEAAPGGTVVLFDTLNGVTTQIGTANLSGGTWATSVTLSGDGAHSINAQDLDAAGNVGSSSPVVFTFDTVPPVLAIGTASATTNHVTQTISGTVTTTEAEAGSTVTLFDTVNGVTTQIGTANLSGGAWTTSVTLSGDGAHSIVARNTDAAGNVGNSNPVTFTLDTVAPTVAIGAGGTTTNQATQTISGTVTTTEAAAGGTVTLFDTFNGVTTQIGTANLSGGAWATSVTLSGNGTHNIVAEDTDAAGNTGISTPVGFTLATVAPTIAITSPIAGDNIINKTEAAAGVTLSGTATAGTGGAAVNGQTATITIVDGTNAIKDTLTATVSGGAWSVNLTAAQAQGLTDGSYTVKANVSDAAGNAATTATQAITVDETAPTIAIASPIAGDNIINKTEAAAGVTLSGTATAGTGGAAVNGQTATITIVDGTNAVKDTLTATVSGGAWSVNLTAAQAQGLTDGSYTVKANVSDAAGNAATTATQAITVDETAPTIAITSPIAGDNIINKTEAAASVTLSGTATAGTGGAAVNGQTATITIVDGTNAVKDTLTATVSGGAWSVNLTAAQAQGLTDGSYTVKANVSDAAGNAATTATQAITVDETAPTIAITSPIAGDNIINKTEAAASVTLSGTATAGTGGAAVNGQTATITIVDSTNAVKDTLTATVSGGAWSVNLTAAQAQGLADGSYTVKANVSDAAGNAAATATQAISVDETAPTIAITSPIAGDNIINKTEAAASVTLSGTATAGTGGAAVNGQTATITIVDGTNAVKDTLTATVSGGAWSVNLTAAQAQGLADGSYTVKANVSDAAGNAAATATQAITVDTVAPTVAIGTGGTTTNQATQTISGTVTTTEAAAGGTVTLFDTFNGVTTQIGTANLSGGAWATSVTLSGNGTHNIVAEDTDAAGNTGISTPVGFTLATVAPTIAITSPIAGDNIINKTEAAAGVTLSGTATAGTGGAAVNGQTATITIVDSTNAIKDTLTATVSGGAWSVNLTAAQAQGLTDGSYTVKANVSDAAGNAATTATQAITVDETAPTIAIASPIAGDNIINKTEAAAGVTLSGTATAGTGGAAVNGQTATITIVDGTNAVKDTLTATVSGGAWSVNLTAAQAQGLADGSYTVKANVSDTAGNAATTATQAITVDETAPTIAIASPIAGDNIINKTEAAASVTLSGTATAGTGGAAVNGQTATITIVDSTNAVKDTLTATVSGGAWSVNLTAAQAQGLADGSYTVKANVSDAAGNAATTATQAISVDETAPTIAITSPIAGDNIINKTEAAASVTLSGTATAGTGGAAVNGQTATITIVDGTNAVKDTLTATVSGGAWSVNLTAAQAQGLADGSYTVKANVSDAAGNAAATATQAITVDTVAPTVAIGTGGTTTNQATQTISGTVTTTEAAAGGTVTLFDTFNGVTTQIGTATLTSGAWSTSVTLSESGTHSIVAKDTDAAGNTGVSTPVVYSLNVVANAWANPAGGNWTVGANWSSGTVPSNTASVAINPIGATAPYSVSILSGATVLASSLTLSDPFATLLDEGTFSIAASLLMIAGTLEVENGGTLLLGGSSAFTTTFAGTGGNLVLGNSPGFTGTLNAVSTADGAVSITGSGNVTTTSGDAIDLTASGGTQANPSNLTLGLTGTISGAANGVNVVQNGVGDITVDVGNVAGSAGDGLIAEQSSTGTGNVSVDATGSLTGTGAGTYGLLAEILNASDTGNISVELAGSIAGAGQYGIRALSNGTGDITVMTDPGSSVTSGGTGISAINKDTAILASAGSTITVTAYGTINSGAVNNLNGSVPKGIDAGYYGASGTTNTAINGTVIIYNYANVTAAAGDGIEGYNEGNGNVTVDDEAGTTVSAALYGITAFDNGVGNINVSTFGVDSINSGSAGLNIYNQATLIPQQLGSSTSTITVTTAVGSTIDSGSLLTGGSSRPAGILVGYKGGTTTTPNSAVYGNVIVINSANITAAGGDGIRAYNYGSGNVTVNDVAGSIVTTDQYGIDASSYGSGQVAVTTVAGNTITAGSYGIQAINLATSILSTAQSSVSVVAYGTIKAGFHLSTGAGENQGISAGYYPNNGTSDTSVNGTVSIDNFANVTSETGYGINAYNWGNGSVTLTDEAGTSVSGGQYGVDGFSGSTGTGSSGSVAITVGKVAAPVGTITSITAGSTINAVGINANDRNGGTIAITMDDNGDKINSGGFGINAGNQSTSATASSNITITARGTIDSGFSGFMPAGINAGYNGGSGTVNANVDGNVFVDDYAAINAASGSGINLYNYGGGNLTATVEAGATVAGATAGVNAYAQGGGNVTITNNGTVRDATGNGINTGTGTGSTGTGLPSNATGTGIVLITNTGAITALGAGNSAVVQINNFSSNVATFNNSGTVTANLLSSGLGVAISLYSGTTTPADTGGIVINNNAGGTISGNVALWPSTFLATNSTFNNASGAIWNVNGTNGFGSATSAINNAGIINIASTSEFYAGSTGTVNATLTLNNSGMVNILADGYGFIGGAVTGGTTPANGVFSIGDRAALEFNSSVVSTQTVSFTDGKGVLTLDNPTAFAGTISGLTFGDTLDLIGGVIANASINSTTLTVNPNLSYNVSNVQPGASLFQLSSNLLVVVPTASLTAPFMVTGQTAPYSNSAPSPTTYIFNADGISGSGIGIGFAASSDSATADTYSVLANQPTGVSVSGNGIDVVTAGANIAIVNAGSITSGAIGINAKSGTWNSVSGAGNGSVDIIDYGSVSGTQVGIQAGVPGGIGGQGQINVLLGAGATITGSVTSTTSSGIIAISGQGSSSVTTLPGSTINSGRAGIVAENQSTSVPLLNGVRTSIVVTTSGAINSGKAGTTSTTGDPAGIVAGYLGNATGEPTIPNPPLTGIFGNVVVNNNGSITATSGIGILAFNYGTGDITVSNSSTITANLAGTAAGSTAPGFTQYGISAYNYGVGNVSVTSTGSIAAGSTGISAGNQATAIPADANGDALSTVMVDSLGNVSSGANLNNNNGNAPAAIQVGYSPGGAGAPANLSSITTTGNVVVIVGGNVTAAAGEGINAYNYGNGNVTVSVGYNVAITAEFSAASANSGNAPYGIGAFNWGIGNIAVTNSNSDTINSGSSGINAVNESNPITSEAATLVTVNSFGSINFGGILTNSNATSAGVSAGYLGGSAAAANMNVNGTVIVNNNASITPTVFNGVAAAGIGINAFNYGNGDITVNDNSGTTVSGVLYGIEAHAEGGTGTNAPTGNVSINLAANATVNATTSYGILALSTDVGDISIVTSSGDTITSGSVGINAVNEQANIPALANSWISVTAAGTINSGTALTGTGREPAGIAVAYLGGGVIPTSLPINVYGDIVVNNTATITALGGDGIRALDYEIGNVTVNEFSGTITALDASSLTPAGYGIGIDADNFGTGNITVNMTAGTIHSGGSGIVAVNQAVSDAALPTVPSTSFVSVLAYGTINSGSITTNTNTGTVKDPAAGILAGYDPNNADKPDNNPSNGVSYIHGTVEIDDYASIMAVAGTDGIRGINYGDGTITIIAEAGAVITAGEYGIAAIGGDGGDISITTSATLTGGTAAIETTTSTSAETVTIENLGHMTGVILTENAAFDNGAGAEWDIAGASTFGSGTNTVTNEGIIDSNGAASITATTGSLSVTNTGTVNVQSGTLDIGASVSGTGLFTIASGATLELGASVASGQTITFEGSTGTLKLDDATHSAGQITGLAGSDGIDLANFNSTQTVVTPVIGTTQTVLTVTDENHTIANGTAAVITLLGNYTGSTFNFSNDTHGGVLIVDPPASAPAVTAPAVATGVNQTLTGTGPADNFVFNFAAVGQAAVTNFHANTDVLQLSASLFANLQALLDATHEDGHGNSVIALDAHDSIALTGVTKAQLNQTDVHFV